MATGWVERRVRGGLGTLTPLFFTVVPTEHWSLPITLKVLPSHFDLPKFFTEITLKVM